MSRKIVETSKMPDGRFVYQIGEQDDMGCGFGMFFVDSSSGSVKRVDENGKQTNRPSRTVEMIYEGEFFSSRHEAKAAGLKALS